MRLFQSGWFALFALATLSGCSGGPLGGSHRSQPTVVVTSDPALDAARISFETARKAVISQLATLTEAAAALDGIDSHAAKGAFDPASREQPAAVKKAAAATAALSTLRGALADYATGIAALTAESEDPELSAAQASAVDALAKTAATEQASEAALRTAEATGWNAYVRLGAAQALWITRAGAGYYPGTDNDLYDAMRAGEAYVVLVNPIRAGLNTERRALAAQTASVNAARTATEASLAAAGAAFR